MKREVIGRSVVISALLHVALLLLLLWAAHSTVVTEPAPVSVELWSAPPPSPAAPVVKSAPIPVPVAPPPVPQAVTPEETAPKADIQLGRKRERKQPASAPVQQKPRPTPQPVPKPEPKPAPKPAPAKKVPAAKPVPDKTAATDKTAAAARPAGKGKKSAAHYNDLSNDLLADLGSANTTKAPNARTTQAGAADGVPGGVVGGSSQARDNYAAKVRAKILPLIQLPPGLQGNPKAVVQVVLLPTLEVRAVKLLQSSGNSAYDEAVQRAIMAAGTFPSLPSGTRFNDVRQLRLEFRPY